MKPLLPLIGLFLLVQSISAQTAYTWNGSVSANWNVAGNWSPNGIPGTLDNVKIVTATNNCQLPANTGISNITLTSGTLDLGGFTLTAGGNTAQFSTGTVQNGTITVSAATSTVFGNGPVTMNCVTNITSGTITFKNTTFQGATSITKTGSSNDASSGGNIFNGAVVFTNAGTGNMYLGNGNADQFNSSATFNNTGSNNLYVANNSSGNVFNGTATFNNSTTTNNAIVVSQNSSTVIFNDSIVVTSTSGAGVQFGSSATTTTLAAGQLISIGAAGFSAGTLLLRGFTQTGATTQNITLTGTANLTLGPSSTFNGNVTATSPTFFLNGCTFNDTTNLTKTGTTGDYSAGGNIFNAICSITNSGSAFWVLGNSNPDLWNSDVTFTDNGSDRLLPCWTAAGNQFNGNINVNTQGSALGIEFCGNSAATATLAAGKTIQVGSGGLTAGFLYLRQFTQAGSTAINLTATGNSVVYLGPSSSFGGTVNITAPDIWAQGATYNSAATFTKTGGSYNHNNQYQNIFNSTCTINQQSSTGYFMLGYNSNDLFNDNITITSTGTGGIYLGWTSGTGTPTLAAGKTIQVGSGGFSAGFLNLNTFTQQGTAPINLSFTGSNTYLAFARNSIIGGNLTTTTPDIFFNGGIFNGDVNVTKTGASNDGSVGGNIFQDSTIINITGAGYITLGNTTADTWNNYAAFNASGSSTLGVAWGSAGNTFNGNIAVSSTGSATGVQFCGGNTTATATLASGYSVLVGSAGFSSGTLLLRQFTQSGSASTNITLTGATTLLQVGPTSTIGGNFTVVSPRILLQTSTFSDSVSLTKTGSTGEWMYGGNTFNSTLTVNQQGSGYFGFANGAPDIYNGDVYANNNSTERIIFGNNPVGNQFNGNIILTQTGSSVGIAFGWGATTNETQASGKTISIGAAGFSTGYLQIERFTQLGSTPINLPLTGTSSLTFGPTSTIGGNLTTTSGSLFFNGCTFMDSVNCTKTGTTSDWSNGNNVFNGITTITNAGSGYLLLGNTNPDQFNNAVTFNNTGSNNIYVAWNSANNVFNGLTTFNNTPTANTLIYVSSNSTGTVFNGNIVVNSTNGQGVQFCTGNTTATATLAAGNTISIGAGGFSAGTLLLRQFTQSGATAQSLTLNGAGYLTFGPSSAFGGNLTAVSPSLFFNGCTFSGTVMATKNGSTSDASTGNNIFNGATTMTNAGSGYFMFGNGNADQFNSTATFNNTGTNSMYVAYNSANNVFGGVTTFNNTPTANTAIYISQYSTGTVFNGNILVTSNYGQGVQFCNGNTTATATLAAGNTISVCPGGFSSGTLLLRQFTQSGGTAQSLTLTGTGILTFGPSSSIGGNITTVSPTLFFNGCTFGGTVMATKNGTTSDQSTGDNIFNAPFTVTNTGSGYFLMGSTNPDLWQSTATFNNMSSSSHMYVAWNSSGNTFNGDVTFNNQPGNTGLWIYSNTNGPNTVFNGNIFVDNINGGGVYFGQGATGSATLAGSGSISAGPAGFTSGSLVFQNFTQSNAGAAQNITLTGTAVIQYGSNATFNGPLTSSSPGVLFNSSTFNGTVNATKTGISNDNSTGNNTFNGVSTFTDNGTGNLTLSNSGPDVYNANAFFVQSNTGKVQPDYNYNGTYAANVTVSSPAATAITFGAGAGTATFAGTTAQTISVTASTPAPIFARLVINNTSGVTLANTSISVSNNLVMSVGLLNTTPSYLLVMLNGSTTAAGDALSTSYVNGPMQYQKSSTGTSTLNFPIGNSPDCRPIVLTISHSTSTLYTYTAQLFDASAAALNYTLPPSVDVVSGIHYYTITRANSAGVNTPATGLSGNQTIQAFFGANDYVTNGGTLTIVKNVYTAPTTWINIGGAGGPVYTAGADLTGSITSTSSPTVFNSFSTFALADQIGGGNVLPIGLLYFNALPTGSHVDLQWATTTESNNSYFTIERSKDGVSFTDLQQVATEAPGGNSSIQLDYSAQDLNPYTGVSYYRLRQTDLNGNSTYSNIVSVNFAGSSAISVYPNPARDVLYVTGLDANINALQAVWYDISGRQLLQSSVAVSGGTATLVVGLKNGYYVLKLIASDGSYTVHNIIIMK